MTTVDEIVKAAIPDAPEGMGDFILWSRTPFPMRNVSAREIYKAASRFERASNNGLRLCDFCDRVATGKILCDVCRG